MAHQEQTIGERAGGAVAVEVDGRERGGEALRDDGADEVVGREICNAGPRDDEVPFVVARHGWIEVPARRNVDLELGS
jgi:hypothetical protein